MTTYEQQRKQRLMTVLSAAVRIGRAGALPDSVVAAELNDLAELYLAAAYVPYGVIGHGPTALTIHNPDFKDMSVPTDEPPFTLSDEIRQSILDQAATLVKEQAGAGDASCSDASPADKFIASLQAQGFRQVTPEPVADVVMPQLNPRCDVRVPAYGAGFEHDHICDKAPGHADGLGGSDHQCDVCGALFSRVTDGCMEFNGDEVDL